uniref:Uncharacterized protein n=1 Tax=Theropithecus gelada TaxID=9565 RepID=A0A8D2E5K9_THEGE
MAAAALNQSFSSLPLSGISDFLQPLPAFAGKAFQLGADSAELSPWPKPCAVPGSPDRSTQQCYFNDVPKLL